jgi:hypothetical protein
MAKIAKANLSPQLKSIENRIIKIKILKYEKDSILIPYLT